MSQNTRQNIGTVGAVLTLYAETPVHVGASAALGAIDLPISRERMSGLPVIPGSGLRGALREHVASREEHPNRRGSDTVTLFGPPPGDESDTNTPKASEHSGCVSVLDARLLLLPLRSARGGWAWATSPMVLQRLQRDLQGIGAAAALGLDTLAAPKVAEGHALFSDKDSAVDLNGQLIVEDLSYSAAPPSKEVTPGPWPSRGSSPRGSLRALSRASATAARRAARHRPRPPLPARHGGVHPRAHRPQHPHSRQRRAVDRRGPARGVGAVVHPTL
ncbi:MAG: type III-B CRISPR module RAMP protein Cmr4 [Deltaproteobacteria bacterium]|nr:type III-B CRISPR module RAMP protein Cmr4 [Deltaproteobacteria bacterium]